MQYNLVWLGPVLGVGYKEANGPMKTFTTHTHTHTSCVLFSGSCPLSRCDSSFMRSPGWSLALSDSLAIGCTLISQLSAVASNDAAPTRPPNPITLGEWVRGCSDWITRGWVAAPMTCCFELVMMLIFSIWPCVCVHLCVSPSKEPIRRLSCTPALMASGEGGKSQSSTITLPGANHSTLPLPALFPNPLSQTSASLVGCRAVALSAKSQTEVHFLSISPATLASTLSVPKKLLI